jgi:hypothetical protein
MVRRSVWFVAFVATALCGARPALAAAITPATTPGTTGHADQDFPLTNPNVQVINIPDAIDRVAQAQWITDSGWVTGWNIKDIRTLYDSKSDTMFVGMHFFSIAGNADGNGTPGVPDPRMTAAGGVDEAHLGGHKSITIAIDPNHSGTPALVAGVPADKTAAGPGTDGFTVAAYKNSGLGIQYSYGQTLTNHLGQLLFDPSKDHPDFEFSITNFSKIPGLNLSKGFWLEAYAGSPEDVIAGEDFVGWTNVSIPSGQVVIKPEPATFLSWSLVLAGAAWTYRRKRRSQV